MSLPAITCAVALRGVSASEKLVLLVLANRADAQMRCFPSHSTLAEETGLSERTVLAVFKSLEAKRLLSRERRTRPDGSRASDRITLHFAGELTSPCGETASPCGEIDGETKPQLTAIGGEMVSPLTSFEPRTNPQDEKKVGAPQRPRRGSRIDPGWLPSEIEVAFAIREGLTEEEIYRAADKFRDHWLGAPDSRGTKLDWTATWRNWIRTELDRKREHAARLASRPANASSGGRGASSFADIFVRNHGSG